MSQILGDEQAVQVSRYCFTINNYDLDFDYASYFRNPEHRIRRAVIGFEVGEQSTRHIQGYVEFERSVRFQYAKQVLPSAHWEKANSSALINYQYCTKQGNFTVIGDFSREEFRIEQQKKAPASISLVIQGLLNSDLAPQVRVSKEYADRHVYYRTTVNYIKNLKQFHKLYDVWSKKLLYIWQYQVLQMLQNQNHREVLWVCDFEGNKGKSFFANYLSILYKFSSFLNFLPIFCAVDLR